MNRQQLKTDVLHLFFSAAVFDAIAKILALSAVLSIHPFVFKVFENLETWPFLINLILANLVGEFLPYLYHRISHIGNPKSRLSLFLWRIHAIHHIPNQMNWYKTSWVHPINMFFNTFLKTLPILYLGFSEEILFSVGVIHIVISYLSHANVQTEKTVLDYLIVTPHLHHFHHSTNLNEAKNFGNIFPFWDLVFRSYYNRKGTVDTVGVLQNDKWHYPNHQDYLKQLLFPLFNSNDKN